MPFSLAIFLASGDALVLESLLITLVATAAGVSIDAGTENSGADSTTAGAGAGAALIRDLYSSPSFPKMARIESTGAPFPSSTPMYNKTPS